MTNDRRHSLQAEENSGGKLPPNIEWKWLCSRYSDALNLWHFHAWLISIWKLFMRYVTNQSQIFYRQPGFSLAKLKNKFGIFVDARSNYAKMPKNRKKIYCSAIQKRLRQKKGRTRASLSNFPKRHIKMSHSCPRRVKKMKKKAPDPYRYIRT